MNKPRLLKVLAIMISVGFAVSTLINMVLGSIWRFGGMGRACSRGAIPEGLSEDERDKFLLDHGIQAKSGALILVLLVIGYVYYACFFCVVGYIYFKIL